jgi:hypothetical protein
MKWKNKKGEILTENVIFIILNIVFFSILLGFIYLQGDSIHLMEEETAKQIALLIDGARPGTVMEVHLEDFADRIKKEGIGEGQAIVIDNQKQVIIVQGSLDSFYEYHYFNDVNVGSKFIGGVLELVIG